VKELNINRSDFLRAPWGDWKEAAATKTNYTYQNIFHLRNHKLRLMQQVMSAVGRRKVKIVNFEMLGSNPEQFVLHFADKFHMQLPPYYKPQRWGPRKHIPVCLDKDELQIFEQEIDWELEAQFGFNRIDCQERCF
jgi:hypothetical protein